MACVVQLPDHDDEKIVEDAYCDAASMPDSERPCWPDDCPQPVLTSATTPASVTDRPADIIAHWRTGTWGPVTSVSYTVQRICATCIQGGPKQVRPQTRDHNSVKSESIKNRFFTGRFFGKFVVKLILNTPPRLAYVATLRCETLMSAKQAINDKL